MNRNQRKDSGTVKNIFAKHNEEINFPDEDAEVEESREDAEFERSLFHTMDCVIGKARLEYNRVGSSSWCYRGVSQASRGSSLLVTAWLRFFNKNKLNLNLSFDTQTDLLECVGKHWRRIA